MVSPYSYPGMKEISLIDIKKDFPPEKRIEAANSIIKCVCQYYCIKPDQILNISRKRPYVQIRQICVYLIRNKTGMPLKDIGSLFNRKEHTTMLHSFQTVQGLLNCNFDNDTKNDVKQLLMII